MDNNQQQPFRYRYNAKDREEIEAIRQRYTHEKKSEDPMERLRLLDASVTRKGTVVSLIIGIIGCLIMGGGMSLVMVGPTSPVYTVIGIVIGLLGITAIALAYPVYNLIIKKERARIAPEILRLTDELMK